MTPHIGKSRKQPADNPLIRRQSLFRLTRPPLQHSLKKSLAKAPAERVVKDIRRATRRHFSAEDKIRIVLDGLRGEDSIAELCRKEVIADRIHFL